MTIELIKTVILGLFAFVSTNLDDFLLLLMLFSTGTISVHKIVLGQYLGMVAILVLSYCGGSAGVIVFSAKWVGILGVVPLAIGINKLGKKYWPKFWKLFPPGFFADRNKKFFNIQFSKDTYPKMGVLSVAFMTLANGGDNIAVYSGLFSEKSKFEILLLISVFMFLTAVWCLGGFFFSMREKWRKFLQTFNSLATPYALIIIGVVILLKLI